MSTERRRLTSRGALAILAGAFALSGCAHRYPLAPEQELQTLSGVPLAFGDPKAPPPPEGTTVRWDFGDGSSATGAALQHAFPFAGSYTVTETVSDGKGERHAHIPVAVGRRSPLMAVPPDAYDAVVLDRFFNRLPAYQALLERGMGRAQLEQALAQMKDALGFDPTRAEDVRAAGIDLDEGVAWVSFAEEPSAHYLLVGTWDDAKSDATMRNLLAKEGATFTDAPNGFVRARVPGQAEDVLFAHDRGYLIVRVPGDKPEPPLALSRFAAAPATGVSELEPVRPLRAALGAGDVLVYRSRTALAPGSPSERDAPILTHLQAALGAFNLGQDELSGEVRIGVDAAGQPAVAKFFASSHAPALPARAPAGAALFLAFSGDVPQLFSILTRSDPGERSTFEMDLAARGVALRDVAAMFGDAAALAGYFDADEFYRALMETRVPLPRGELLLGASLRDPATALNLVRTLLSVGGQPPGTRSVAGGTQLLSTVEGHPSGAFVSPDQLLFAWGVRRLDDAIQPGATPRLQRQLSEVLPPDALAPGKLVLYVDVQGVLDALEPQHPIAGLSPDQQVRAQLMTRMAAAPLAPFRDLLGVLGPAPEGMRATLRLRLRATR